MNCEETSLHTIGVAEEPRTESVKLAKATTRREITNEWPRAQSSKEREKNFIAALRCARFSVVVIAALRGEEIWGKEAR